MTLTQPKKKTEVQVAKGAPGHSQDTGMGHPILDNSLTSLSWLQNLRVLDLVSPDVSASIPISPNSEDSFSWESHSSESPPDRKACNPVLGVSLSPIRRCLMQSKEFNSAPRKYRSDSTKPSFSYTTLIYLSMRDSKMGKVTLSDIYKWIRLNFKYYRHAESSWEVRCFICLQRSLVIVQICPTDITFVYEYHYFWHLVFIGCCRTPFATISP